MSAGLVCTLFLLGSTSVIVYAVPQQKNESCRKNMTQNGDNCYFAEFTNKTTWLEAQKTCRQMNMNLVSINNERENSFIHSMIKDKSQKIWIGLKRQPGGTLNGFAWTDGSLANFTKWNSGEPNNEYGNEDYVEMLNWNGEWNDLPLARGGEIKKSFICKTQILPSGPTVANVTGPPYSSHNQSVRLSCCTDGAIPGIDFQWDGVTCINKTNAEQCSTCTMTSVKEEEGKIITCTATNTRDRSKHTTATYRIAIAYGPSKVTLFGPLYLTSKQSETLSCTAYDAIPGVKYTWSGISCVQSQLLTGGSTCSFTPSESDDGKIVACTARNLRDTSLTRTGTYKISIAVETTASTTQVTTSHGHHDITCTESRMEFSIPLSSPHTSETATLSDPNCQINLTRTHVRGGVDLNSCGTTVQFQNDSVIFRNAIIFSAPASSSLDSNGSDVSQFQDIIPIECVYNRIATVHLSYMPVVRRVLFTESGVGQFSFNIQQFWDASFTSVVSDRAYPLRLEQDADIFIQLSVGSEGQPVAGHKEIGMEVQQCLVSPSSSVIEAQLHYYPLIQDGCPASSDVHIIPNTNASDSTVMRFRFRAVNFFDPSSSSSSSLVFVHCRMGLCLTGSCKPSAWTCLTPPARRVRRDVDQSRRAAHQLSTGPFLIMADEASASSSSTTATVMAVVSTSVATVAIVVAAIALIALRRRRTTARN